MKAEWIFPREFDEQVSTVEEWIALRLPTLFPATGVLKQYSIPSPDFQRLKMSLGSRMVRDDDGFPVLYISYRNAEFAVSIRPYTDTCCTCGGLK